MNNKTDAAEMNFKAQVKRHIDKQMLSELGLNKIEALLDSVDQTVEEECATRDQQADLNTAQGSGCDGTHRYSCNSNSESDNSRDGRSRNRFKLMLGMVASLLLLVLGVQLYPHMSWQDNTARPNSFAVTNSMSWKIADEVAKNHIKMKPLEVQTKQLSTLRQYFTELDFAIVNSSRIGANGQMLGGRYCSVQGLTAAQIRFSDQGQAITLYEVQYDRALYGELPNIEAGDLPIELVARGVAVSIWVEKGLLMASARLAH
ncbi:hypothetical protein [Shewanella sp. 0m-4]